MGRADHYEHGDPNMICDRCGQKFKKSMLRETWDHLWVCEGDWEPRQPQDKLKAFPDHQSFEDPRPEGTSSITYWDGSNLVSGTNEPTQDDFLETNEVKAEDL